MSAVKSIADEVVAVDGSDTPSGGSATPGGSAGQLQYNSAGSFAGLPGSSVDPLGVGLTFVDGANEGGLNVGSSAFGVASASATSSAAVETNAGAATMRATKVGAGTASVTALAESIDLLPRVSVAVDGDGVQALDVVASSAVFQAKVRELASLLYGQVVVQRDTVVLSVDNDTYTNAVTVTPITGQGVALTSNDGLGDVASVTAKGNPGDGVRLQAVEGVTTSTLDVKASAITLDSLAVKIPNLPVYADNAAAIAGGVAPNQLYRTATGVLMVAFPVA